MTHYFQKIIFLATAILFLPIGFASAESGFPNPLPFESIADFLSKVLSNLQGIVAVLAIGFIVLGGMLYMLSAGNEKMITRAKACWTGAVIGMAIALAAPTFLKEIKAILGGGGSVDGESMISGALTFQDIALNILYLLLSILGIIGIIALVAAGMMYLTSYGDEERNKTAKKIATYAIIGIIVALSSIVILRELMTIISGGS